MSVLALDCAHVADMVALQNAFSTVRIFSFGGGWQSEVKIPLDAFLALQSITDATDRIAAEVDQLAAKQQSSKAAKQQSSKAAKQQNWLLTIPPLGKNGFAIDVSFSEDGVRCLFGELEEQFETLAAAMIWVKRALSSDYQLRIVSIGGHPCEWLLEPVAGSSDARDTLAVGNVRFWRLKAPRTTIRRNDFAAARLS